MSLDHKILENALIQYLDVPRIRVDAYQSTPLTGRFLCRQRRRIWIRSQVRALSDPLVTLSSSKLPIHLPFLADRFNLGRLQESKPPTLADKALLHPLQSRFTVAVKQEVTVGLKERAIVYHLHWRVGALQG